MKVNEFDGDLMSALERAVKADAPAPVRKRKRAPLPACLEFAGVLGHTWITTAYEPAGGERIYCQCSDGPRAYAALQDCAKYGGRIFTRTRKGWREVRPTLAAIS